MNLLLIHFLSLILFIFSSNAKTEISVGNYRRGIEKFLFYFSTYSEFFFAKIFTINRRFWIPKNEFFYRGK